MRSLVQGHPWSAAVLAAVAFAEVFATFVKVVR
jgi:hypothetical protein